MRSLLPPVTGDVDLEATYAVPSGRHVRANMVSSADGGIRTGEGTSGGLGGPADRDVLATVRRLTDVILVGAGTVRAEGYGPAKTGPEQQERRRARGQAPVPPIAVVSSKLDLDPATEFFTAAVARPLLLTVGSAPADRRAALEPFAEIVEVGDEHVDLAAALDALAARGLERVLCEGGPSLLGRLAGGGLLDELCLTVGGLLVGPSSGTITGGEHGPDWSTSLTLRLAHVLEDRGSLFLRYAVS